MSTPRRPEATYQMEKFEVFSCGHWSCLKLRLNAEDHGLRMSQAGSYRSVVKHANTLCEECTAAAQLRDFLFKRSLPKPTLPQQVSPPTRQYSSEWEDQDQTITKPESVRCRPDSRTSTLPLDGSTAHSNATRDLALAATFAALEGRSRKCKARGCLQPLNAFLEKAHGFSSQVLESVGEYWDAVQSIPEDIRTWREETRTRREDTEHVQACVRHSRYIEEQGGNPDEIFGARTVVSDVEPVGLGIALLPSTPASPFAPSAIYPASPPVTLDLERDRGSIGFLLGWGALRCCNVPEVQPAIAGTEPGPRRRVVKPRAKDLRRRKTGPRTRMPRKVDGRLR
ncbi:hypothetical protein LTR56_015932 [Elasticomyces elasticus]|nr:hypothetical protein LTR56_015932 [Elasticomyces elasticus]KAK3655311.1 hypothetical protein LTR22_010341 [Elasticomyces elasticus]KAK4918667.1 hypothetical protein LTR49_013592 [Elasticomyces elasticus]KAK5751959.1 hypothetical protein LTS12_017975 [Elasticomyces elasticus]